MDDPRLEMLPETTRDSLCGYLERHGMTAIDELAAGNPNLGYILEATDPKLWPYFLDDPPSLDMPRNGKPRVFLAPHGTEISGCQDLNCFIAWCAARDFRHN